MPLPRPRLFVALGLTAISLLTVAVPSEAATQSVKAATFNHGKLVFKTHTVSTKRVRSVRLKNGRRTSRSLKLGALRRGIRRGSVKVNAPRKARKRVARVKRKLAKRQITPVRAQQVVTRIAAETRLVISTVDPVRALSAPNVAGPRACGAVPADSRYVSPSGSDSNPGTIDQPFLTLNRADEDARPGTTIALRGGTIGESGKLAYMKSSGAAGAPIRIVAYPGETPTVAGQMYLEGAHREVCGLLFDKPTGPVQPSAFDREGPKIFVAAADIEIRNSEVRGARGAGIFLTDAENARIVDNYVHDNGRFDVADHANLDHGIYFASGSGLVARNRIEHNVAHAVQLYPNARGVTVRQNRMSGHGRAAVMVAEDAADNVIEDNDIYNNRRGVETYDLRGNGNVARGNRLWGNSTGNFGGGKLALVANDAR